MEKMFGERIQGFCSGMSAEDKQKMMSRFEKMAALCPCGSMSDKPDDDRKAMMERMQSCCGGMMETMSSFFKKTDEKPGQAGASEKE